MDETDDTPQPLLSDLEGRYGPLFGRALSDRWEDGGREIDANYLLGVGEEDDDEDAGEDEEDEDDDRMEE